MYALIFMSWLNMTSYYFQLDHNILYFELFVKLGRFQVRSAKSQYTQQHLKMILFLRLLIEPEGGGVEF